MQDATRVKALIRIGQACGFLSLVAAGLVGLAVSVNHSIPWVLLSVVLAYLATRLVLTILVMGPAASILGHRYGKQKGGVPGGTPSP